MLEKKFKEFLKTKLKEVFNENHFNFFLRFSLRKMREIVQQKSLRDCSKKINLNVCKKIEKNNITFVATVSQRIPILSFRFTLV